MPIHDQGYRHYAGNRVLHGRAWWVIARTAIAERLHDRWFIALLLFAWSRFMMRAVQVYIGTTIARASFVAPNADTFHAFLNEQRVFVFFITIYAGAGLIANDRQSNALQIYLSRPITRIDYVAGKFASLAVFLVGVTWVPAMLLLLLEVLFSGSVSFVMEHPRLIPAITATSVLQVVLAASTMAALSSLSRSRRFVSMLYAGIVLFAAALDRALRVATDNPAWILVSPQNTLAVVTDAIFDGAADAPIPIPVALLALVAILAMSAWVLERRVRAVEAVG